MYRPAAFLPVLALVLGLLGAETSSVAAESTVAASARDRVSLVSDVDQVAAGQGGFQLGLQFQLSPGWHVYWQNPGDAGLAPTISLTLPPETMASPLRWPVPRRLAEGPVTTYGYEKAVLLPFTVTPSHSAGGSLPITASANWLVCRDICVPESGHFRLDLPIGAAATPSPQAPLFAAAERATPKPSDLRAWIAPDGALRLRGSALAGSHLASAYFFPDAPGLIDHGAPQLLTQRLDGLSLALKPEPALATAKEFGGVLALTATDGSTRAIAVTAVPGAPPAVSAPIGEAAGGAAASSELQASGTETSGLWTLLAGALLGGLILNLMPCVFPILAMKAAHLAKLSGGRDERRRVVGEGLAYGAGVLLSFAALGAVMLSLRETGHLVGWGFQFQSPIFVLMMIWLLFAVGLGFSGVIAPGGRWAGWGQSFAARGGAFGSLCTGVLAAVVATPCTAPFMGAAVAAALSRPAPTGMAIFLALGLGLALPFVVVSLVPGIGRLLPRPGGWMEVLRQALAFPVYASVLWLIWVVSREGGGDLLLAAGGGMLLIAFAAWVAPLGRRLAPALAALAVVGLLPVLLGVRSAPSERPMAVANGAEAFSGAKLAALRAAGRPAFVDLTAAWCVSCLVNERVALDRAAVRDGFRRQGITYLVGDWTRGDPEITGYLRAHRRDGVPLYVYYPAGGAPAVVLPQILTPRIVLDAIGERTG
jgi:thiol:disulfide interchange protein/DsbC/DsbD-like thiol-disulfide interchange protein